MKNILLITAVIAGLTASANGQAPRLANPREAAEAFFNRIAEGEVAPAYDQLLVKSPVLAKAMQVDFLKRQTETGLAVYGKILGFELYEERKFGQALVELIYIQRLERHALVWKLWFYRPADDWIVNLVTFNDQLNFQ
jgi:hypothetical protein